jgi:hypothetical protein
MEAPAQKALFPFEDNKITFTWEFALRVLKACTICASILGSQALLAGL